MLPKLPGARCSRWAQKVRIGTASITRSKTATAEAIFWLAIAAFAIRARTMSPTPQNTGAQRNAGLARSSGTTPLLAQSGPVVPPSVVRIAVGHHGLPHSDRRSDHNGLQPRWYLHSRRGVCPTHVRFGSIADIAPPHSNLACTDCEIRIVLSVSFSLIF